METFKDTFINDGNSSMKKVESFAEPGVIKRNNYLLNIFENESTSEMFMEIIVWLTVVGLVIFTI